MCVLSGYANTGKLLILSERNGLIETPRTCTSVFITAWHTKMYQAYIEGVLCFNISKTHTKNKTKMKRKEKEFFLLNGMFGWHLVDTYTMYTSKANYMLPSRVLSSVMERVRQCNNIIRNVSNSKLERHTCRYIHV